MDQYTQGLQQIGKGLDGKRGQSGNALDIKKKGQTSKRSKKWGQSENIVIKQRKRGQFGITENKQRKRCKTSNSERKLRKSGRSGNAMGKVVKSGKSSNVVGKLKKRGKIHNAVEKIRKRPQAGNASGKVTKSGQGGKAVGGVTGNVADNQGSSELISALCNDIENSCSKLSNDELQSTVRKIKEVLMEEVDANNNRSENCASTDIEESVHTVVDVPDVGTPMIDLFLAHPTLKRKSRTTNCHLRQNEHKASHRDCVQIESSDTQGDNVQSNSGVHQRDIQGESAVTQRDETELITNYIDTGYQNDGAIPSDHYPNSDEIIEHGHDNIPSVATTDLVRGKRKSHKVKCSVSDHEVFGNIKEKKAHRRKNNDTSLSEVDVECEYCDLGKIDEIPQHVLKNWPRKKVKIWRKNLPPRERNYDLIPEGTEF